MTNFVPEAPRAPNSASFADLLRPEQRAALERVRADLVKGSQSGHDSTGSAGDHAGTSAVPA